MYTTITSKSRSLFKKARKSFNILKQTTMEPTTTKTEKVYPHVHTNRHDLFTFVEVAPKNVVICVGQQQVSEKHFNSLNNAKTYVTEKSWELICNVASLVAQHTYNELKKKEDETNS